MLHIHTNRHLNAKPIFKTWRPVCLPLPPLGAGKLLALHNGDGRVLWSRNYPPAQAPTKALTWRTFHDISHAPQVRLPSHTHTSNHAMG